MLIGWIEGALTALFSRATVKFVSEAEDWRPVGTTVLRLYLLTSCGIVLLLWLLAPLLAALLGEPSLTTYLRLLALDLPFFGAAQVQRSILIGLGAFRPRALASAGRWIARLLLVVLLVELGFSVWGALLGNIGASVVELLISRYYVRPSLFCPTRFPTGLLWPYALPLFFSTVSVTIFNRLDLVLLKALGGTAAQAGIYGAAQNFPLLFEIFALSFTPLLLSTLSRLLLTGDKEAARAIGGNALRVVVGLLPFASLIAGAASEIVTAAFGPLFSSAAPLAVLLSFGALAQLFVSVSTAMLTAAGKPRWTFALTGPLIPLALIGHLVFIPQLGPIGAALVTAFVAFIGALAAVLTVYRVWQILLPKRTLWRSVVISLCVYVLAALWPAPGIWLLCKLPVLGLFCLLAFLVLGEFNREELALASAFVGWGTRTG
jgi:O-antigen/teichoic acid export membrane protein